MPAPPGRKGGVLGYCVSTGVTKFKAKRALDQILSGPVSAWQKSYSTDDCSVKYPELKAAIISGFNQLHTTIDTIKAQIDAASTKKPVPPPAAAPTSP